MNYTDMQERLGAIRNLPICELDKRQPIDNVVYRDERGDLVVHIVAADIYVHADTCETLDGIPSAAERSIWTHVGNNLKFTD